MKPTTSLLAKRTRMGAVADHIHPVLVRRVQPHLGREIFLRNVSGVIAGFQRDLGGQVVVQVEVTDLRLHPGIVRVARVIDIPGVDWRAALVKHGVDLLALQVAAAAGSDRGRMARRVINILIVALLGAQRLLVELLAQSLADYG